jgi:hypothetical protein
VQSGAGEGAGEGAAAGAGAGEGAGARITVAREAKRGDRRRVGNILLGDFLLGNGAAIHRLRCHFNFFSTLTMKKVFMFSLIFSYFLLFSLVLSFYVFIYSDRHYAITNGMGSPTPVNIRLAPAAQG